MESLLVSCGGDVNAKVQDCESAFYERYGGGYSERFLSSFCKSFPTDKCTCKSGYILRQGICIPVKDYR